MNHFIIILFIFISNIILSQTSNLSLYEKHSSFLSKVFQSSNENYIFTVSLDNTIKLWNLSNGKLIKTFSFHENKIIDIAIDKSNKLLFSLDESGLLIIWNIESQQIEKKLKINNNALTIHWDAKNKQLLISTEDGKILWFQYPEMTNIKTISTSPYSAIKIIKAKTPDLFYVGLKKCKSCLKTNIRKGNVQMYDETLNTFIPLTTYDDDLTDLYLSPDSTKLVSASAENYLIRVWDTDKLLEEATIKNTTKPASIFMSKTNTMIGICSAENGEINIYRNTGHKLYSYKIDTGRIIFGYFSDDLKSIYLLDNYGKYRKYDFPFKFNRTISNFCYIGDEIKTVAYSQKFKTLLLGLKKGKTKAFNINDSQTFFLPDSFKMSVKMIKTNSNWIAVLYEPHISYNENNGNTMISSKVALFDLSNNHLIKTYNFNNKYATSIYISANMLFVGYNNGLIEIYSIPNFNKIYSFQNSPFDIHNIYFNPKTNRLITTNINQKLLVYYYKPPNTLKTIKTLNLKTNEDINSILNDNIVTNQRIIVRDTNLKYINNQAVFTNSNNVVLNIADSLLNVNILSKKITWELKPKLPYPYFMLADSSIHKLFIINKFGNIQILNAHLGKWLCNVYFDNNAWIVVSENYFDVEKKLNFSNEVKTVNFNNSTLLRKEGLLYKLLNDKLE